MGGAYVALDDRLVVSRSEDGWLPVTRFRAERLACLDVSRDKPERVFVGTVEQGLQRSIDGGVTFDSVGDEAIEGRVTAVAVSPHDPATVWAGTEPSRVYRSTNAGSTWALRPGLTDLPSASRWSFPPRPNTHHVRWIEPDPHQRGRLYVAIEAGALVRTDDAGETWQDHPEGARRDNHTVTTHPDAPGRVSVAAGDGYAESVDGGDTWTYPQDGLEHQYVWSIAADPSDHGRQIVSAAASAWRAHSPETADAYVYSRSGQEWSKDMHGLPKGRSRAVLDATEQAYYTVTDRGLYRRVVDDENWSTLIEWPSSWDNPDAQGLVARPQ